MGRGAVQASFVDGLIYRQVRRLSTLRFGIPVISRSVFWSGLEVSYVIPVTGLPRLGNWGKLREMLSSPRIAAPTSGGTV
jgi:hypothetical protein